MYVCNNLFYSPKQLLPKIRHMTAPYCTAQPQRAFLYPAKNIIDVE